MKNSDEIIELTGGESGERLDVFLSKNIGITRAYAQKLIKSGNILNANKPAQKIKSGEIYRVNMPELDNDFEITPEPVNFDVIYEDKDIIVINKPAGIVTHPAPGNWRGTLANGLLYKYPDMKLLRNKLRPGIVHRLDSVTSGLMVVARTQKAYEILQKKFQEREITKKYLSLIHGIPEKREGILSGPIGRDPDNRLKMAVIDANDGGRPALTGYKVLNNFKNYSLVICSLFTGRTHQIRVHMAAFNHPVYGDTLYGSTHALNNRIFLHSWRLEFKHPISDNEMKFFLPLPEDLIACLQNMYYRK